MVKKDGYCYCDFCKKRIDPTGRRGIQMIRQNLRKNQLTFCDWDCAFSKNGKPDSKKKFTLNHLTRSETEELKKRLKYGFINQVYRYLKRSNVDGKKFTDIVLSDNFLKRRDEFYKLFKYENDADTLWVNLMNWCFNYTEQELRDHMYDTMEEIHKAFGIAD
jgi:hypothetical protein